MTDYTKRQAESDRDGWERFARDTWQALALYPSGFGRARIPEQEFIFRHDARLSDSDTFILRSLGIASLDTVDGESV